MNVLKPYKLEKGDTIGIFTPSSPAYAFNEEMFQLGIKNIFAMKQVTSDIRFKGHCLKEATTVK